MRVLSLLCGLVVATISLASPAYNAAPAPAPAAKRDADEGTIPECAPHNYTFEEFKPGTGSFQQPYFRFSMLFRMKAGVSKQWTNEHWKTVHADITMAAKDTSVDILRYVQFHSDQKHRDMIQPLIDSTNGLLKIAPYDGIAEFHAKDAASIERFIKRAFANPVIAADQNLFVDGNEPIYIMPGYDNVIYGSGVETSGGFHGLLPHDPRFNY